MTVAAPPSPLVSGRRGGRGAELGLPAGLLELTGPEREVLVLRLVVGLSAEQTARVLGCSPMSVRIAQHRALDRLRDLLRARTLTLPFTHFPPPSPPSPAASRPMR